MGLASIRLLTTFDGPDGRKAHPYSSMQTLLYFVKVTGKQVKPIARARRNKRHIRDNLLQFL